jgi:peptidoglycan/LPS O-acetylase OafA/YrhL
MLKTTNIRPIQPCQRYIPSLDGLRGISIIFVLYGHLSMEHILPRALSATPLGLGGVVIFFAISGFLITSQLPVEGDSSGTSDLKVFYLRRAFRLLPAALAFLITCFLLNKSGVIPYSPHDLVHAWTYTMNFSHPRYTTYEHLWSLSVEEQFYLVWPFLLVAASRLGARRIALFAIIFCPFWRVLSWWYFRDPGAVHRRPDMIADTLAFGCLLALNGPLLRGKKWGRFLTSAPLGFLALITVIACCAVNRLHSEAIVVTYSVEGVCAALMINNLWSRATGAFVRFSSWPVLIWIGRLSYSLYLWQQIFLLPADMSAHATTGLLARFPGNLLAAFGAACLSYYIIEKPIRRFGYSIMHKSKYSVVNAGREAVKNWAGSPPALGAPLGHADSA